MSFDKARFIKPNIPFVREYREINPAPMFRRTFTLPRFTKATLRVCGLGYGYYWLNGKSVSQDKLTAPVSDYSKTLWYTVYDVSELLTEGENIAAVICGNGFFNEAHQSSWGHNEAKWRDNPKFILELDVDGKTVLATDDSWRCKPGSAVIFNQLRSGEYFDARLYDPAWNTLKYDDSAWEKAVVDTTPPTGTLRECLCEPIHECAVYPTKNIIKTGEHRYIFDIGQNISGYVRLRTKQKAGDVITMRYAEQINEDGSRQLNEMDKFYKESPFQTDKFICSGEDFTWSPMFVYHGFRYIECEGITAPPPADMVSGVFVHQDVGTASTFECSDNMLNKLFRIGQMATLSNLFYMPTDCPTREKLGWANDAQASTEQMLTNFTMVKFFEKWIQDIFDAMRDDGAMPGIIPTNGWGFTWGNGPVSDGVLFEVPHKIYLFSGKTDLLVKALPYFKRYFTYLLSQADPADGLVGFGLDDWAPPTPDSKARTPAKFINAVLYIKFLRIALLAARFGKSTADEKTFTAEIDRMTALVKKQYIDHGACTVNEQCAAAMLIFHGIYDDLAPLKQQLLRLVEEQDFHHTCGMVGLRHLYDALTICGAPEYAYRVITAKGYPGYGVWLDGDATTLWETWQPGHSKNHHMYSDFMSWLMKNIVGIRPVF
ncbi:MAG: family 78 glycoside hydrolase catalytic domain, partial [Spirochaetota bacterium]